MTLYNGHRPESIILLAPCIIVQTVQGRETNYNALLNTILTIETRKVLTQLIVTKQ